ncbi:MAG: Ada metal-binding domain-containing protein [Alphaproteobacteria bacterium]|nr:Ada metal-binding domain-containing protein [Alphaproteobacteria bacterium]
MRRRVLARYKPAMASQYATDAARWKAVQIREKAADGQFWTCVRTTGIYCLASCSARPLRKNVFFVKSSTEALAAGYRACKRCRPGAHSC